MAGFLRNGLAGFQRVTSELNAVMEDVLAADGEIYEKNSDAGSDSYHQNPRTRSSDNSAGFFSNFSQQISHSINGQGPGDHGGFERSNQPNHRSPFAKRKMSDDLNSEDDFHINSHHQHQAHQPRQFSQPVNSNQNSEISIQLNQLEHQLSLSKSENQKCTDRVSELENLLSQMQIRENDLKNQLKKASSAAKHQPGNLKRQDSSDSETSQTPNPAWLAKEKDYQQMIENLNEELQLTIDQTEKNRQEKLKLEQQVQSSLSEVEKLKKDRDKIKFSAEETLAEKLKAASSKFETEKITLQNQLNLLKKSVTSAEYNSEVATLQKEKAQAELKLAEKIASAANDIKRYQTKLKKMKLENEKLGKIKDGVIEMNKVEFEECKKKLEAELEAARIKIEETEEQYWS